MIYFFPLPKFNWSLKNIKSVDVICTTLLAGHRGKRRVRRGSKWPSRRCKAWTRIHVIKLTEILRSMRWHCYETMKVVIQKKQKKLIQIKSCWRRGVVDGFLFSQSYISVLCLMRYFGALKKLVGIFLLVVANFYILHQNIWPIYTYI